MGEDSSLLFLGGAVLTSRERVFARIEGRSVDQVPNLNIIMAFAAKYIGKTYREYATDFRVLCEGNIRCCEDFGIDMVSAISDPAREVNDLGGEVIFPGDDIPYFGLPLLSAAEPLKLKVVEPSTGRRMSDRIGAIDFYNNHASAEYPVLGWVEGPLALAADLRTPVGIMEDFFERPEFVVELLEFCLEQETIFALEQVRAGADFIGIGDAICSVIGPRSYSKFGLPYEKLLIKRVHEAGAKVKLHICGDTTPILSLMINTGADIIDVDWMVDFASAVKLGGVKTSICGNFDPVSVMFKGSVEKVADSVEKCLDVSDSRTFIAAGCEIPRGTPLENMLQVKNVLKTRGGFNVCP